jgi:DNA mismatch repair protein MutS
LIVLLAQIGSFVPRQRGAHRRGRPHLHAHRLGRRHRAQRFDLHGRDARDREHPEQRQLALAGRAGRGRARTSTFDGLALAWAIVEHLHEKTRARALFATHYHQLTDLATRLKGVCNMNVSVREWHDEIVFLHKIVDGGTDRSYGIHVARLAGVPREVLERAKAILSDIERDAEDLAPRIATARRKGPARTSPARRGSTACSSRPTAPSSASWRRPTWTG